MMRELRKHGKYAIWLVAAAFIFWLGYEGWSSLTGRGALRDANALGRVNGQPVLYPAYQATYQQLYDEARRSRGELSPEDVRRLQEEAWQRTVDNLLIEQEIRRRGLTATDEEVRWAARWMPHPALMQNERFQTNGQFDLRKYQEFLNSPAAPEELLLQLEQFYRDQIPRLKLAQQLTASLWVSDAELWQLWKDERETATVEAVALRPEVLVPGAVPVSERELRQAYERRRDQLRRPAGARLTLATFSKAPTAADTAAALQRARQLRAEILAGADFGAVAQRESADSATRRAGGRLTVRRGETVPAFEAVAFSLPIGQVSEPVLTPFGVHLVQVLSRQGDVTEVRHILVPLRRSEEELDALYDRADSLAAASPVEFERAARRLGAQLRRGVTVDERDRYVPGAGDLSELLDWALDPNREANEHVSPTVETREAFVVARLEAVQPAGVPAFAEVAPQLRVELVLEKKKERARQIGERIAAEARRSGDLARAAARYGLRVDTVGPFNRTGLNPYFGFAGAPVGVAFGLPLRQVSGVVASSAGLFLVRPIARTTADRAAWAQQKEQQRRQVHAALEQRIVQLWLESLRRQAKIVDRRREVLRPSA